MKKFIFNQVPCLKSVTLLKIKSFNRYFLKIFFMDIKTIVLQQIYLPTYLPTDRLTDRPTDRPTDQLTDWLTDWSTDRPTNQLTSQSIDYPSIFKHTVIYIYKFLLSQLLPLLTKAWKRRTCCCLKNLVPFFWKTKTRNKKWY